MRKSVFEYEDLLFRQILAQGRRIKIAAIDDKIRERTPSYYLSLLSQEFGRQINALEFKESLSERRINEKPAIPIDDHLRNTLKEFTYSFSSLSKILTCPFLFYHQYILGIEPPSFMADDEKINMQTGLLSINSCSIFQLTERTGWTTGRGYLMNSGKAMKTKN